MHGREEKILPSKEAPKLPNSNKNVRVRIYHQMPRAFANINELKEHLIEIASMGFTHVWISPIQDTEKEVYGRLRHSEKDLQLKLGLYKYKKPSPVYSGSLYSMRDDQKFDDFISINPEENEPATSYIPEDRAAIKEYTQQARKLGITPIFDLVINQVSKESPLYKAHPEWFKKSGPFGKGCAHFNYNADERIVKEIIQFWKNYITRYVEDFGFQGARIDAIKHIPAFVQQELYQHLYQECWRVHEKVPVIFVEAFLGGSESIEDLKRKVTAGGSNAIDYISHITNFIHWEQTNPWKRLQNWKHVAAYLGELNQFGGNVGFPGCHDEFSLYNAVHYNDAPQEGDLYFIAARLIKTGDKRKQEVIVDDILHNPKRYAAELDRRMKERIAVIALSSSGGWYHLTADEFALPGRRYIFSFAQLRESFANKWGADDTYDLRDFICKINKLLVYLPQPTPNDWIQHIGLAKYPDLVVVILHNGPGFSKENAYVSLVNLSDELIALTEEDLLNLSEQAGRFQPPEAKRDFIESFQQELHAFSIGSITVPKGLLITSIEEGYENTKKKLLSVEHIEHFNGFKQRLNRTKEPQKEIKDDLEALISKWENFELEMALQASVNGEAMASSSKEALADEATQYGFECQDVPGDGNCFFSAVERQLSQSNSEFKHLQATDIREKALNYILTHLEQYSVYFETDREEFINKLLDGEWADHVLIHATAKALSCTFVILESDGSTPKIINKRVNDSSPLLYLGHEILQTPRGPIGWHYQSLLASPTSQKEKSIQDIIDGAEVDTFEEIKKVTEDEDNEGHDSRATL